MTNYPPYRIETERLVLRCWNPKDSYLFHEAISSSTDHLRTYMPFIKKEPLEINDRIETLRIFRSNFDNSSDFVFGIFNKAETKVIGSTGLHKKPGKYGFEIGYWIVQNECNNGFATEAVEALLFAGFYVVNIDRIEIFCNPENIYSRNIPEKLMFTHEVTRKRINTTFENEFRDSMIWVLFKDEYVNNINKYKTNQICYDALDREIKINYDQA